jgi:hypothetical protein
MLRGVGSNHRMVRFSSIIYGVIFVVVSLSPAESQETRPVFPPRRPQPTATQPGAATAPVNSPQATPQITPPQGTAPANAAQQRNQQQPSANRPADPPPTTPAVPPVVTYRDGLLTVQAVNSNLSSVLTAIRNKTGIEFEGSENVADRVAISLGPAPAGEVLAAIFAGSRYDFVAIGRPDNPGIVQRVILTSKSQPGAVATAQPQPKPSNGEGDEEDNPDEQVNAGGDPQDTPVQPVPIPQLPQQQPPQTQNEQPKTPEQLLQELQEMRRQKGSPPGDPNAPPVPRKQPPL